MVGCLVLNINININITDFGANGTNGMIDEWMMGDG